MKRIVVACLMSTTALTGCILSPSTVLRLAGVEPPASETPEGPLDRVALTQEGEVVLSGYQHAPTLDWSTLGIGQPFSLSRSLFEGIAHEDACQLIPRGTPEVTHVPRGAEAQPLHRWGIVEVGVAGNVAPSTALLAGDAPALGLQAVATSARLGTQGTRCSYAYLYLALGRPTTDRVVVSR